MLSKGSEKILKRLYVQEKGYRKNKVDTIKIPYKEIKNILHERSHALVVLHLNYLLEERYIYNHIEGKEHHFNLGDLEKGNARFVIGERGVSYIENKKYSLLAKIIPLIVSVFSLIVSIFSLFMH